MRRLVPLIRDLVTRAVVSVAEFNRARRRAVGPNPYLVGIHAPMTEERTLTDLEVTGAIPPELDGTYLRNGPNPITAPNPATHHWFVGTGMVHGLRLQGGRAHWYRNRWIRGHEVSQTLGEPPAPGVRTEGFDTPNTNVIVSVRPSHVEPT